MYATFMGRFLAIGWLPDNRDIVPESGVISNV